MGARIAAIVTTVLHGLKAAIASVCVAAFVLFVGSASHAYPTDPLGGPVDKSVSPIDWSRIPPTERTVLAPLEREWTQLAGSQQRRLIGAAREYPKLSPGEKERFQTRLRDWVALTPGQRQQARDKHRTLTALPPEKQAELRQRWQQSQSSKSSASSGLTPSRSAGSTPKP